MSYHQRLAFLNLLTLELRLLIADLIMYFDVIKSEIASIKPNYSLASLHYNFLVVPLINCPIAKLNVKKFFFTNRVILALNVLPDVEGAQSTTTLKHCVLKIDLSKFLTFQTDSL